MKEMKESPSECSQCGASIPRGALNCPGCGADERTGWDSNPWLASEAASIPDPEDDEPPSFFDAWRRKRWLLAGLIAALALIYMVFQRGHPF